MEATNFIQWPNNITWEISDTIDGFAHRLVMKCPGKTNIETPWVRYEALSVLKVNKATYIIGTPFWEGVLDVETLLNVKPVIR